MRHTRKVTEHSGLPTSQIHRPQEVPYLTNHFACNELRRCTIGEVLQFLSELVGDPLECASLARECRP